MEPEVNLSAPAQSPSEKYDKTRISFTITNSILCLPIILLDIFVLTHYIHRYRKFVPCMFLLISTCDGLMAVFVLVESAIIIKYHQEKTSVEADQVETRIRVAACVLWNVLYRVSTFVNVVLCVAKTLKVRFPFYRIRMKLALASITFYLMLWVPIAAFEYHGIVTKRQDNKQMKDKTMSYGQLGPEIGAIFYKKYDLPNSKNGIKTYYGAIALFILTIIPFIIPSILSLVCLFVLVKTLRKPATINVSAAKRKYVTITATCITFLFFVCTSLSTLYQFIAKMVITIMLGKKVDKDLNHHLYPLFNLTLPLLNAAISPLIIVLRSSDLKAGLTKVFNSINSFTGGNAPSSRTTSLIVNPLPKLSLQQCGMQGRGMQQNSELKTIVSST